MTRQLVSRERDAQRSRTLYVDRSPPIHIEQVLWIGRTHGRHSGTDTPAQTTGVPGSLARAISNDEACWKETYRQGHLQR